MANWEIKCDKVFGISSFSLDHDNPDLFVNSQWTDICPGCGTLYGGYRITMAILWVVILIMSVNSDVSWLDPEVDRSMWYLFLSNWSLIMIVLDAVMQATIWIFFRFKGYQKPEYENGILKKAKNKRLSVLLKIEWIVFNIALGSGIVSSLVDGIYVNLAVNNTTLQGLLLYAINSIYLVINLFFVGVPLRFFHFLHTSIYLSFFVVVSALIHYMYRHDVYTFLNWGNPLGLALNVSFVLLFGIMLMWALLVLLSLARRSVASGFSAKRVLNSTPMYNLYDEATA